MQCDSFITRGYEKSLEIKGVNPPAPVCRTRISALKQMRKTNPLLQFAIEADGAIRQETVGGYRDAGADSVVPGSLLFQNNPAEICRFLRAL